MIKSRLAGNAFKIRIRSNIFIRGMLLNGKFIHYRHKNCHELCTHKGGHQRIPYLVMAAFIRGQTMQPGHIILAQPTISYSNLKA